MDNNTPNTTGTPNTSSESVGMTPITPETIVQSDALMAERIEKPQSVTAAPQELGPSGGESANQNAGMVLPTVVATPPFGTPDPSTMPVLAPVSSDDQNPATADDVDIVEKEWVDRAKKIVDQTRDDPHKQEQEVEKLQTDYLKKRYGKEIKPSDV